MIIYRYRENVFISLSTNPTASGSHFLPSQRPSSGGYVVGQFERFVPVPYGKVQDRCRAFLAGPAVTDLINGHPFTLGLKPNRLDSSLVEDSRYSNLMVEWYRFYAHARMVSNGYYSLSS